MQITESKEKNSVILFVSGRVDSTSSQQLMNEMFRALKIKKNLALDFSDVFSIDEEGIKVLQSGVSLAASKGGTLELRNAGNLVKNVLNLAGLSKILTVK
ncbi:MAG: STAS domain-containing protein [Oscillospiraceae bacterium]|jgi:anti-sigma B factor antagonist|nr:STAS domain-containing protein [Oscillospiraceae bacterium]